MRRAFTLIEMTIVVSLLLLMAAWIAPNLVALQRARMLHEREAALLRLPAEARDEARRSKEPVALRVEGETLVVERTPAQDDPQEIKRLTTGQELPLHPDSEEWRWTVYPDGSAQTMSLTVGEGEAERILILPARGEAHWQTESEAAQESDDWPAGEIATRG